MGEFAPYLLSAIAVLSGVVVMLWNTLRAERNIHATAIEKCTSARETAAAEHARKVEALLRENAASTAEANGEYRELMGEVIPAMSAIAEMMDHAKQRSLR